MWQDDPDRNYRALWVGPLMIGLVLAVMRAVRDGQPRVAITVGVIGGAVFLAATVFAMWPILFSPRRTPPARGFALDNVVPLQALEAEFADRAIDRGGGLMFSAADAMALLERCRERGVTITAIEAYAVTSNSRQLLLDRSLEPRDLPPLTWTDAAEYLARQGGENVYFKLVSA